ncbi:serpin peptidase inhibitor, clade F (alpha-2 antiplasmin, pigment epithelium derived factor), member 2b [Takifugu flavidus]|uniref:serpin peptidase inhibitor, clade F (alpha-2 antiplasmin, pigment epithelium derived factor), member 2b n=1 Tax=Takifugu flavidus TaxID=433684 RepID=UPI0025442C1F|nr:serpin peptidase inhibitor, clade F (alpha-2 antiplasmin, pigment epithelium derived factor), member 2b [Takifugu flavidus]XP_056905299.1 serpin peptidase inhibitor, clade F (alpha-2 antiplasmin, pigment epithelium derived factor), member 2b [Takifugu flavidus]
MDLHLTLLLICLCSHGIAKGQVTNESIPLMPLIPLIPSIPIEKPENNSATKVPAAANTSQPDSSEDGRNEEYCLIGRSLESREAIAAAIQKLGVQLLQNLEATPEQPNIIISPLSISLALSQLALGAVNETRELLMHHLHERALPCYHESLHNILAGLRKNDLQIATQIFLRQGFQPKQDFVNKSRHLYGSEPAELKNLQQINDWVYNATNGKMPQFLSALPLNVLVMLINAVHFKGDWVARFDPRFTSRGAFYLDDNNMIDVEVMEDAKHPLSLFIDNELDAQVAKFRFRKLMSLLVVMPTSSQVSVASLLPKLNVSKLYSRLPKERAVQVKVPKFKLEYSQELQEVFTKIGLGEIFSRPNLAEIADGPLLVSSVMHKSTMEINEEGAEAAAATTVVISRASSPVFHMTQPFFFAVMDDTTEVPIFMGVINNPNPGAPVMQTGDFGSTDKVGFPIHKSMTGFEGPPK